MNKHISQPLAEKIYNVAKEKNVLLPLTGDFKQFRGMVIFIYTIDNLLELLPYKIVEDESYFLSIFKKEEEWIVSYYNNHTRGILEDFRGDSLVDLLGETLLHLLENDLFPKN